MALPLKSVLPATWEVPAEFHSRLGEKAGRQRAMMAEGHLLLVLHAPPKKDEPDRKGRLFWRKPDGTWLSNELGGGSAALAKHLNEYAEIIDKMDRQEDVAWSVDEYYQILDAMGPVQRSARNLHATLQEARKLLSADRDLINFRDRAYDIERTAELLYNDVRHALEFAVAKKSEEQAANAHQMAVQSHRLNLLVAFFFPLATLVAIFGSEMKHGLDQYLPEPYFFYTVVGIGLVLGGLLAGWLGILNRYKKN
ncbi:MAG: hypothetical protein K8R36_10230 [Planctomycetales bacterium]|nr:hypothetical protein [Planctomycetales bacterium]